MSLISSLNFEATCTKKVLMNGVSFWRFVVLVLALATPLSAQEQPNVLLVYIDDLGWKDVG